MVIESIIWIVVIIIIGLILFKVTKSILKAIFLISSVAVLIMLVLGFLVISDAMDFNENFQNQSSIFVLEENNNLIAGLSGIPSNGSQFTFLTEEELGLYNSSNLDDILEDNYKLFLMKKQAFNSIDKVESENMNLTKQQIFDLIDSEDPIYDYLELQPEEIPESALSQARQSILDQLKIESGVEFKGVLFASLFGQAMQNPLFLFEQHQKGNITVYPETAMFKFMKRMPLSVLSRLINKKEGE